MGQKAPTRGDWKFKGRAGRFHVWHVGPNQYHVTEDADGKVVSMNSQFGNAYSTASRLYQQESGI